MFLFIPLPASRFSHLFSQSDDQLRAANILRMVVDDKPGFPCRVSLVDAEIGETVLLLPFTHHDVPSPYRASGPIFVRQGAPSATPAPGSVPLMFHHRLLSIRAYDAEAMLLSATIVNGPDLEPALRELLADPAVSYLHLHNARPGCFNCAVVRA